MNFSSWAHITILTDQDETNNSQKYKTFVNWLFDELNIVNSEILLNLNKWFLLRCIPFLNHIQNPEVKKMMFGDILSLKKILISLEKWENVNMDPWILITLTPLIIDYIRIHSTTEISKRSSVISKTYIADFFIGNFLKYLNILIELRLVDLCDINLLVLYSVNSSTGNRDYFQWILYHLKNIRETDESKPLLDEMKRIIIQIYWREIFIAFAELEKLSCFSTEFNVDIIWDWCVSMSDVPNYQKKRLLWKNLQILKHLVQIKWSDYVENLIKNFGVTCFGRYSTETLMQKENFKDENGIIINSIHDNNAAFYETWTILEDLENENRHLVISEVTWLTESYRKCQHIKKSLRSIGLPDRMKYLIVQAHGDQQSIIIGDQEIFLTELLLPINQQRLKKFWDRFFIPNWTIIISSCLSNIIAKEISRILIKATVYASDDISYLDSIWENQWRIYPRFMNESGNESTRCYRRGKISKIF